MASSRRPTSKRSTARQRQSNPKTSAGGNTRTGSFFELHHLSIHHRIPPPMNPTPPVRLGLALCFVLFAICWYFLQPDSKEVLSSESAAARPSLAIQAGLPETASDSTSEGPAPSEAGEMAKMRLPAAIVPTSPTVSTTHPSSAASPPGEIRNAPARKQTNAVRKPREISDGPEAATAPRALLQAAQATTAEWATAMAKD